MPAAKTGTTMPSNGIKLVNENYAWRLLLGLLKHVPDTRRADADKHLYEVRTGNGEERHLRFARYSPGQQCLAGARRTDQKHALGNPATQTLELARVLEEIDDFDKFRLRFIDAGYVGEGNADLVLADQARLALADRHSATTAAATLHLTHEIDPDADQQEYCK